MRPLNGSNKFNLVIQFTENISIHAKILCMCPGAPIYMPGANKYTKTAVTSLLTNTGNVTTQDFMNSNYNGKYFDFRSDYLNHMLYVTVLCRALAVLMGIGGKQDQMIKPFISTICGKIINIHQYHLMYLVMLKVTQYLVQHPML